MENNLDHDSSKDYTRLTCANCGCNKHCGIVCATDDCYCEECECPDCIDKKYIKSSN